MFCFTAHQHRREKEDEQAEATSDENQQPTSPTPTVPITSVEELETEMPSIVNAALQDVSNDRIHALPTSKYGQSIVKVARRLLAVELLCLYTFLVNYFAPLVTSSKSLDILRLRHDEQFADGFLDLILSNMDFELELKLAKCFVQRFLTSFVTAYYKRQLELIDQQRQQAFEEVSDNDRQVIFYICGYVLHALRKRYIKSTKKGQLIALVDKLHADTSREQAASEWTNAINRGGLKQPSERFFLLIVQIERWARELVDMDNLKSDTLVKLKEKLLHYQLLRVSWEKLIAEDNVDKWLVLDHIVGLFFKVRGFAVTKLLRKQLQQKRKASKIAAGTKKALRKELRQLSN